MWYKFLKVDDSLSYGGLYDCHSPKPHPSHHSLLIDASQYCVNVRNNAFYLPTRESINNPTTVKQEEAKIATTSMKAKARFGSLNPCCTFFNPLSITGAKAAAPATLKGLVTLFPVHMRITIWPLASNRKTMTNPIRF